jgi:hypothetical protein
MGFWPHGREMMHYLRHEGVYVQMMVILEYCAGGNLHKALRKDSKSPSRRLVRISPRSLDTAVHT